MMPVGVQVYQFSVMVLAGIALGVVYDFYRTFRVMTQPGRYATVVYDCLLWVIATLVVLGAVFYANWGEVRAYVFIGAATGMLGYFKLASPVVLRLLRWTWRVAARFVRFLGKVLNIFLVIPLKFAWRVVARIFVILGSPVTASGRLAGGAMRQIRERFKKPPVIPG